MFNVVFIVNISGKKVARSFNSPVQCRKFVNKLKYSKHCTLVSYPNIIYS